MPLCVAVVAQAHLSFFQRFGDATDYQGHQATLTVGKVGSFIVEQDPTLCMSLPKHLNWNVPAESCVDFHAIRPLTLRRRANAVRPVQRIARSDRSLEPEFNDHNRTSGRLHRRRKGGALNLLPKGSSAGCDRRIFPRLPYSSSLSVIEIQYRSF